MDRLRQMRFKLRALWRRRNLNAEMAEEMRAHLERMVATNRDAGMTPDEARRQARRHFGNVTSLEERARDEQRFRWLEALVQDLRFRGRQLRLHPGFAITAIVSLALGIGASTAIFSAVDAILFRALPLPDAERLSVVRKGPRGEAPRIGVAPANALEMVAQVQPFAETSPFTLTQFVVRQDLSAERVTAMRVASTFFKTLGVAPALGRDFTSSDDQAGAERVAIISSALWHRTFAGDLHVVGRTLDAGDERLTVVGVLPEGFRFPALFGPTFTPDVWTPLAFTPNEAAVRGAGYMWLLLKRRNDWQWNAVQRELDLIARAYETLEPTNYGNEQLRAMPLQELVVGETGPTLLLLWAAVSCLLLVACANTANVVLSRAVARSRELAIRAGIGAPRGRLFAQLIAESSLLAVIAAGLGLLFAWLLIAAARGVLGELLPRAHEVAIDWRVVAFTIGTSGLTSLAVGLVPAQRLSAMAPRDALSRAGTRGSIEGQWATGLRRAILVGQIAVAIVLGTTAVLLGRSFAEVLRADLGFRPESLLTFELSIPKDAVPRPEVTRLYATLVERLEARPHVMSVGALNVLPLGGGDFGWSYLVGDKPVPPETALPHADVRIVTPGTLETLGVALRAGRSFDWNDGPDGQPVALVNETFARQVWPGEHAIGKQIKLAGPVDSLPWMTVIGVAEDVRFRSPDHAAAPAIYRPQAQHGWGSMAVVVRTTRQAAEIAPAVREEVEALGRGIASLGVREFTFYLSRAVAGRRLVAALVTTFAAVSLVLALVGVYGLFTYAVTSRTREIGVRIALGASPGRVVWMLMRDAVVLGGLGVVAGVAGVFAARRLIQTQLFEIQAMDLSTLALVSAIVVVTALIACYVPSRRAIFVDPTRALRTE